MSDYKYIRLFFLRSTLWGIGLVFFLYLIPLIPGRGVVYDKYFADLEGIIKFTEVTWFFFAVLFSFLQIYTAKKIYAQKNTILMTLGEVFGSFVVAFLFYYIAIFMLFSGFDAVYGDTFGKEMGHIISDTEGYIASNLAVIIILINPIYTVISIIIYSIIYIIKDKKTNHLSK